MGIEPTRGYPPEDFKSSASAIGEHDAKTMGERRLGHINDPVNDRLAPLQPTDTCKTAPKLVLLADELLGLPDAVQAGIIMIIGNPKLASAIAAWPTLSEADRAGIEAMMVAMVKSASSRGGGS